jgi:hypothetical protein
VSELTDLSRRNDELMAAKESDSKVIRELDNQLKEYKRKYEQAKTELRTVKGNSSSSMSSNVANDSYSDVATLLTAT